MVSFGFTGNYLGIVEPTMTDSIASLLDESLGYASHYLQGLDQRPVGTSDEARRRLSELEHPLPVDPVPASQVLATLNHYGSPATTAIAGGRFFGYVCGGSLPAALAANWLATAWDQDAGMSSVCPINATLEELVRHWLIELFGLPVESGAAFVTGGTMANFSALAAARHRVLADAGWDVGANGLFGAPEISVYAGAEAHVSVFKALSLLGFGRARVKTLPVDSQGRIIAADLPEITAPAIVCLQAGNVNTGAIDPLPELCAWAHAAGAWVHIDGAFGMWAAASPQYASLVLGLGEADSWATDAHKWLNVPYDSGIAFVRNGDDLRAAMATSAAYLVQTDQREPDQFTPEMSRRARGVDIWAALMSLGRSGLAELIERCCRHARRFASELSAAGYEILNEVSLNQVLVSFG
jgi:glutamate/tyrosine decarboxylase-like PLP-dependent enzyme